MNLEELRKLYVQSLKAADEIREKYNGKPKDMPGDELERWEQALKDADLYKDQIALLEKQDAHDKWAKQAADRHPIAGDGKTSLDPQKQEARSALIRLMAYGPRSLSAKEVGLITQSYQLDDPAGGGFFQLPMEFANEILTLLKDKVFVRALARTFPLEKAESLGVPAIDVDPSDTDWTTELATGNLETTAAAGRRELKPNPMAKRVKISKTLIRKSPNFETTIMDRITYKVGITEEKAFLTGDGNQKPLGLFTASTNGISTARDVAAAASGSIAADDLIEVQFSLKSTYRAKAAWLLNRTVLQQVRQLKDDNNNYIWATGLGPGTGYQGLPSTLLGAPYYESEYAPGSIQTGLYTALFGDFSFYFIADALDMELQVLDQLYAETNQMGYIIRKETDGMPALEEAFARLKQP